MSPGFIFYYELASVGTEWCAEIPKVVGVGHVEVWHETREFFFFFFFYSRSAWSWVIHYSTHTHTITATWSYTTAYLPKSCPHFGILNAALMQNALLFHNRLKNIISWFVKADISFTPPRKAIRQCYICGQ